MTKWLYQEKLQMTESELYLQWRHNKGKYYYPFKCNIPAFIIWNYTVYLYIAMGYYILRLIFKYVLGWIF